MSALAAQIAGASAILTHLLLAAFALVRLLPAFLRPGPFAYHAVLTGADRSNRGSRTEAHIGWTCVASDGERVLLRMPANFHKALVLCAERGALGRCAIE